MLGLGGLEGGWDLCPEEKFEGWRTSARSGDGSRGFGRGGGEFMLRGEI